MRSERFNSFLGSPSTLALFSRFFGLVTSAPIMISITVTFMFYILFSSLTSFSHSFSFSFHHVVLLAWISLALSRHPSLSFIAFGRSSRLHPVSAQSCCILVLAGHPILARSCEEVHRSILLMSSSLLLQQCPACLVHLTWIVFVMCGRWLYSCCFAGCCPQDLFNTVCSILCNCRQAFFPYL